jgi:hypothetical protein
VRIRRLLSVLALFLSGSPTPLYAALGDAPRCLPAVTSQAMTGLIDVSPRVPELRRTVLTYDLEEREYLIRTIAFEASGEPEVGKAAVAHVILNRKSSGIWGDSIKDVVTHPWQFEPWMTRRKEMEKLSPDDPRYRDAAQIADAVLSGQLPDPTAGATHFLNPTIVRQRRGGSLPSWARGQGQPIGRHTFYALALADAAPQPTALSLRIMTNPILMPERSSATPSDTKILATRVDDSACESTRGSPPRDLAQQNAR